MLFSLFSCLRQKFFAQFFFIDDCIISSAKLRTILLIDDNSLFVNWFIWVINASSSIDERRCLWMSDVFSWETDWFFHRRRRVLSTTLYFLAVASILGLSCNSRSAIASFIGVELRELFMVEVKRGVFWKFG